MTQLILPNARPTLESVRGVTVTVRDSATHEVTAVSTYTVGGVTAARAVTGAERAELNTIAYDAFERIVAILDRTR